jgi:archaellum component FlaC
MIDVLLQTESKITVILVTASTGEPKSGVTPADVTLYYRKAGGSPVLKTLSGSNFLEIDAVNMPGVYEITFSAGELDTEGPFVAHIQRNLSEDLDFSYVSLQVAKARTTEVSESLDTIPPLISDLDVKVDGVLSSVNDLTADITGISTAVSSIESDVSQVLSDLGQVSSDVQMIQDTVIRIAGLNQENYRIINQQYNADNKLVGADIRIFGSAADTLSNSNPIATYQLSAVYNGSGLLIDYRVTRTS